MENLIHEGLTIEPKMSDTNITLVWLGQSRSLFPGKVLDPYFEKVIEHLRNKELIIDFSQLVYMSSSTVLPIISFIKQLKQKQIPTLIKYDDSISWQNAAFPPLAEMLSFFENIPPQAE